MLGIVGNKLTELDEYLKTNLTKSLDNKKMTTKALIPKFTEIAKKNLEGLESLKKSILY